MPAMTEHLYYTDSYLTEFSANVLEQRESERGVAVVLDRTAFYPDSGGQPCDTGILAGARVLEVAENDAGNIVHLLDHPVVGGQVSGRIDWKRRFDHMQQHSAQHILSQAFLVSAQARTLSFHLGQEASTIDIELEEATEAHVVQAEALATEVVFQNRPVRILATDQDGLKSLGVRKESKREGPIRVIDIDGFDRSPCGGTHVRNTGEIGLIFVSGFERYKKGTRIEFVAGGRALEMLRRDHELLKKLGRLFSAGSGQILESAGKLMQEKAALSREMDVLQERLLDYEAGELIRNAVQTAYAATVRRTYTDRNLESVKTLARKLTSRPGVLALLALGEVGQIVVARSSDLPGSCHEAIRSVAAQLGGKGGGRPELAQAGGFRRADLDSWMNALESHFAAETPGR